MSEIIKGSEVAAAIREKIHRDIEQFDVHPCLAVIRVGEKGSDLTYERGVKKTCENTGIELKVFAYPEDITHEEFEKDFPKSIPTPSCTGYFCSNRSLPIWMKKCSTCLSILKKTWTA